MSEATNQKGAALVEQPSLASYVQEWMVRVRSGDLGSLPIIIGIIAIAGIFGTLSEGIFFRERNFVNLLLQMSGLAAISMGVVFVCSSLRLTCRLGLLVRLVASR